MVDSNCMVRLSSVVTGSHINISPQRTCLEKLVLRALHHRESNKNQSIVDGDSSRKVQVFEQQLSGSGAPSHALTNLRSVEPELPIFVQVRVFEQLSSSGAPSHALTNLRSVVPELPISVQGLFSADNAFITLVFLIIQHSKFCAMS
jgi:hypothetical protein